MTKAAAEIRKIFELYSKELSDQKKEMSETLTKWGNTLIRQIEGHMAEQKKLLDQYFESQKRLVDTTRKQFLADAAAQEKKKDNEEISRLLAECKALKFGLAEFLQYENQILFIKLITEEQPTLKKEDENSANKTEENQSQNRSTEDDDNDTGNSASTIESSPPKPTSANSKQTSRRSSTTQISPSLDQSTSGDDNLKPDVKSGDDTTNKCPVCFMIFPQSMIKYDREQHVNEHYGDD